MERLSFEFLELVALLLKDSATLVQTNVASNKQPVAMAESFMPASLQEIWNATNIRGFMMLSLFLQVLLASTAHLRRASTSRFFLFVIWSAYFMADWVATFTFGLISNAQRIDSISPPEVNENLLAFWAAFLLIHLGGPDTITAFSQEDNALWKRHLVGLVAQLSTFFYIFFNTLPDNNLIAPTIRIAFAGAIKYRERTRSLYLASMENLKKSTGKLPVTSLEALEGDYFPDKNTGKEAYYFFQIFKGLVVEINPNHTERAQSREFFLQKDAKEAFDLMVAELNLLFELFYTKISSVNSPLGVIVRMVTVYSVIGALILYSLLEKKGFHEVDIWITYFLLGGSVAQEKTNGMILTYSNWMGPARWFHFCWALLQAVCFVIPFVIILVVGIILSVPCGCFELVQKSWSKKLGELSLLSHCIEHCHRGGNKPLKYAHLIYRTVTRRKKGGVSWNVFDAETRDFIFKELKERALAADDEDQVKEIYEARGSWILKKLGNSDGLMRYVKKFDYDRSLLAWHIATEICHNANKRVEAADHRQRKLAVKLSYYMHYLLIKKPEMMFAVVGIGHIRYGDTCAEVEHFCRVYKVETVIDFCNKIFNEDTTIEPADVYKDKRTSVLSDACNLARLLMQKDNKWEIISGVWVELLTYAAGHCRPEKHARAVSQGGELVTIVWLLMAHLGIGPHFPYPED